MKKGTKVAWIGVVMVLLLCGVAYLFLLEAAKRNLQWNVMMRTEAIAAEMDGREPVDEDDMDEAWRMLAFEIAGASLTEPGPRQVRMERLERRETTRLELEGFDLLIETPESMEEVEPGEWELRYPGLETTIYPSGLRAEMDQRPAAWGDGSYDKLLKVRRTMGDEVEGTWNLAKVRDVEERLAEKICRTPILKRGTEEEVLRAIG